MSRDTADDAFYCIRARLDILPESQRALWPELEAVPSGFVLCGGTALALRLGHRVSEDFDFFSSASFDPDRLRAALPFLRDLPADEPHVWLQRKRDNLEVYVQRGGGEVKLAFFGGLDNLRRVRDPQRPAQSLVQVASILDPAGMKMRVIQARANWKDYVDVHAIVSSGVDMPTALAAAGAIDSRFDPATSIRALQFYGDGTLSRVPPAIQRELERWARAVDISRLPPLSSERGLAPKEVAL